MSSSPASCPSREAPSLERKTPARRHASIPLQGTQQVSSPAPVSSCQGYRNHSSRANPCSRRRPANRQRSSSRSSYSTRSSSCPESHSWQSGKFLPARRQLLSEESLPAEPKLPPWATLRKQNHLTRYRRGMLQLIAVQYAGSSAATVLAQEHCCLPAQECNCGEAFVISESFSFHGASTGKDVPGAVLALVGGGNGGMA